MAARAVRCARPKLPLCASAPIVLDGAMAASSSNEPIVLDDADDEINYKPKAKKQAALKSNETIEIDLDSDDDEEKKEEEKNDTGGAKSDGGLIDLTL